MEFWKKPQIAAGLLALGLLGLWVETRDLYAQLENQRLRAETMEQELQSAEQRYRELSREHTALQEELRQLQSGSVVSAYALEVRGVREGKLLVDVSLDLTLADKHTSAEIGGSVKSVSLTRNEDGTYTGQLEIPLDADGVTLRLSTSAGGVKRSEVLAKYSSVTELLPLRLGSVSGDVVCSWTDGKFYFAEWGFELEDGLGKPIEVADPTLRVYQNKKLCIENACFQAKDRPEKYWDSEESCSLDCKNGDIIEFRFACKDRLGLGYEFPLKWWEIKDGKPVEHWPTSAYPTLT